MAKTRKVTRLYNFQRWIKENKKIVCNTFHKQFGMNRVYLGGKIKKKIKIYCILLESNPPAPSLSPKVAKH